MTTENPRLILGGNALQNGCFEFKPNVSTYSDSCREVSLIGATTYSALIFPDIKLTRLENDASCLKYLQKPFKRKRFKSSLYDSDSYETDSLALSGSDTSADESSVSEYNVSDTESSSDESVEKTPRVKLNRINDKVQSTVNCNLSKDTQPSSSNYVKKVPDQSLKLPIVKLTRLENDENCHKYLNQNFCLKMSGKKSDKKLNPIVIITNPNVCGKEKTSFMIKKPDSGETSHSEESDDSCYTSSDGSDDSHNLNSVSCNNNKNSFSLNLSSHKPSTLLSKECSITLKPLSLHSLKELAEQRKLSLSSESAPALVDLSSEDSSDDSSSSFEEKMPSRCLDTGNFEPVSEESNCSEIMRIFEPDTQNSTNESNSTVSEEENSTANVLKDKKTKVYDSGIGISDDTVSMSEESFILMSTVVIPNDDPDFGDGEERYIVEFIDDDDYERLRSEASNTKGSPPVDATCDLCSETFTSRSCLYEHIRQNHNCTDIYECVQCGQVFNHKACLVYHFYARLSVEDGNLSETHICPKYLCSKKDFTDSELEFLSSFCSNHASLHSQLVKLEVPAKNENIIEPDNTGNDISAVQYSPKTEESWPLVPIKNEECSESALISSVNKDTRRKKLKRKSSKEICRAPIKNRKSKNKAASNYVCHLCNEDHNNKKKLFDHLSDNHCHIYYLECDSCEKLFQNSISLASHYVKKECIEKKKMKGWRNKPAMCEVCNKSYKNHTTLRKHKMNIHNLFVPVFSLSFIGSITKLPPCDSVLNCLFCYEMYSSSIELSDHERNSHNYFSCFEPVCSEKFYSRNELERHLFFHFSSGESSFCSFCEKLFFTRQYLENHIIWHLQKDSENKIKN